MGIENRGFASMDKEKAREAQSKGGRTAQASGCGYRLIGGG